MVDETCFLQDLLIVDFLVPELVVVKLVVVVFDFFAFRVCGGDVQLDLVLRLMDETLRHIVVSDINFLLLFFQFLQLFILAFFLLFSFFTVFFLFFLLSYVFEHVSARRFILEII